MEVVAKQLIIWEDGFKCVEIFCPKCGTYNMASITEKNKLGFTDNHHRVFCKKCWKEMDIRIKQPIEILAERFKNSEE